MSHPTETGMRPHEIANATRNQRVHRRRVWWWLALYSAVVIAVWLGLSIGGGELLRWGFPK